MYIYFIIYIQIYFVYIYKDVCVCVYIIGVEMNVMKKNNQGKQIVRKGWGRDNGSDIFQIDLLIKAFLRGCSLS